LAQAPTGTFRGAISMGFCPDLSLPKPLCRENALEWKPVPKGTGYIFLPSRNLETPWIALLGTTDHVCNVTVVESFVKQVGQGQIILLPKVGHGFAVTRNWMPQFKQAFASLASKSSPRLRAAEAPQIRDLPLVEVSAAGRAPNDFAVVISGDGGWAGMDRDLGNSLASQGIPVVGLNALQYFWTPRTPEGAAKDLERILRYYFAEWNKQNVILIGYSRGAEVLPFMANRLPEDLLARIRLVALVGPSPTANFEFHVSDWLGDFSRQADLPVAPEVEKLKTGKIVCIYGSEERDPLCKSLASNLVRSVVLRGGHHFDGDYQAVAEAILEQAK